MFNIRVHDRTIGRIDTSKGWALYAVDEGTAMNKRVRLTVALVAGAFVVSGCSGTGRATPAAGSEGAPGEGKPGASAGPAKPAKPSAPPTTPAPSPKPRKLKLGADGDSVSEVQSRLKDLGYDPGRVDGEYGESMLMAVWAFQKVNRLPRTSTLGKRFHEALAAPRAPEPLVEDGKDDRVEIDLKRQLLYVFNDGQVKLISHVSSGSGELFCAKDKGATKERCRYAVTPPGDFRTGRRFEGWETSPLGKLYNPVYFNGGIAVHGAPSVPLSPASHGCVRIPISTAGIFPKLVGDKVPVHVRRAD
jgi:peptidoglycan hydrolase-like protein with peptidoglycan-binding domain